MRRSAVMAICLLFTAGANSAVKEREIDYKSGDVVLKGLLAYDDALPGKRPAVLVVHEYEAAFLYKRVAAMLASGRQASVYAHAPL